MSTTSDASPSGTPAADSPDEEPTSDRSGRAPSATPANGRTRSGWWPLLTRLHFYAGVLVAPFLLVAALTGLAYTAVPQLDQLVYGKELRVEGMGGTAKPLTEQIAAAREAHPEGTVLSVIPPEAADHTTKVGLSVPELAEQDKQRTVYVDPYTAEVRGTLTTWFGSTPLATWLDDLHRNLHLGKTGRLYSELAASWLWVLVLGGLLLWFGRRHGPTTETDDGDGRQASWRAHPPQSGSADAARLSVMPLEREGGQAQFIVHDHPTSPRAPLSNPCRPGCRTISAATVSPTPRRRPSDLPPKASADTCVLWGGVRWDGPPPRSSEAAAQEVKAAGRPCPGCGGLPGRRAPARLPRGGRCARPGR
ncbi:PepSY domain-containing protein [Streptomyces sp. HNM0645]|uniref:PepSY-associated TM helix domain-containing protein n=1 Tax=Streptomyces sp. HNM0645 TaxID=2782343 RepID=UPI0024B73350|nr:PepSY domain-containing protein [Streptomyces sp. HNM0645]MDI9884699.1 PepSY domain-containing protein [Streptomyces sp. HNM0645]